MTGQPDRTISLGSWISSASPVVTELAADAGFDWLLIDLEHGSGTEADVLNQLRGFRGSHTLPIVRVGAAYPDLMARLLDWGAAGIMVPHVETAQAAKDCVQAMRYPPLGHRGVSRSVRAYGYGNKAFPGNDSPSAPLFIAQIETVQAVLNVEEIAAVDGVDVLFVGPADLQWDLKAHPESHMEGFSKCLERVGVAANRFGKKSGLLIRGDDDIRHFLDMGFSWLAMESDLGILRAYYLKSLCRMREQFNTMQDHSAVTRIE